MQRKPFPEDKKKEFVAASKEYHMYKHAEKFNVLKENNAQMEVQVKAQDAIVYLPDYLMEECFDGDGEVLSQDLYEFRPAVLYME